MIRSFIIELAVLPVCFLITWLRYFELIFNSCAYSYTAFFSVEKPVHECLKIVNDIILPFEKNVIIQLPVNSLCMNQQNQRLPAKWRSYDTILLRRS